MAKTFLLFLPWTPRLRTKLNLLFVFFEQIQIECSLLIRTIGRTMIVAVGGRDTRYETVENVRKTLTKPLTVGNHYYVGALVTLERSSKFLASTLYVDIIMHLSMYRLRLSVYARAPTHTYTHFTVEPPCSRTSHYNTSGRWSVVEWRTESKRLRTYPHGVY